VLMRGPWLSASAARRPDGEVEVKVEPNGAWRAPLLRRIPVVRGVVVLGETLVKGMSALQWSANVSLGETEEQLSGGQMGVIVAISLAVTAVVFFASPAAAAQLVGGWLPGPLVHVAEGLVRAALLFGYLALLGRSAQARRLFAYHGAEHKTIHAFEHGLELAPEHIQPFSCAHPRCGTSFLLAVVVVSTLVFTLAGDLPLEWRLVSRVVLVPVIAGLSYEVLRFGAAHRNSVWGQAVVLPGLWLQRFTTREPDDGQVEVAIAAFQALRLAEANTPAPQTLHGSGEINA